MKLRTEYERVIRDLNHTIKKLQKEREDLSFSRKEITRQWLDVLEDVQKEHEKEVRKLKKAITELLDIMASLKNCNIAEEKIAGFEEIILKECEWKRMVKNGYYQAYIRKTCN